MERFVRRVEAVAGCFFVETAERRVLHFGVTEHPGSGWFRTPFAHISRTLTFLRFLFLAANLPFSLQASVAHPR